MEPTVVKVFEPVVGVAEFAQMIRESGKPICNETLLAMAEAKNSPFAGYGICIYRMEAGNIEGFIPRQEAERWIDSHLVEAEIKPEYLAYAKMMEEASA